MWRDFQTDHPADTTQSEAGEEYTWTTGAPPRGRSALALGRDSYKHGLGVEPEYAGDEHTDGTTEFVATEFDGETPDGGRVETYTVPLVFPGCSLGTIRRATPIREPMRSATWRSRSGNSTRKCLIRSFNREGNFHGRPSREELIRDTESRE